MLMKENGAAQGTSKGFICVSQYVNQTVRVMKHYSVHIC